MNENRFDSLIRNLYEGLYVVDRSRKIVFWNKGAEEITGYKAEEVVNSKCYNDILHHVDENGVNLCHNGCPLLKTLNTGETQEAHVYLHHKDGHRVSVNVKSLPLYDQEGNVTSAIEVFTDSRFKQDHIKENRKLKEQLNTDPLTKLYNRRYLDFYLRNLVRETEEFDISFAILFVDIDHFKVVNDTYGHQVGDQVLKVVAKTLKSNVRTSDIVGRFGGEEFIVILKDINLENLTLIAEKLRYLCLNSTIKVNNDKKVQVTISIGGTLYKGPETIKETIERADKFMYESKSNGRNQTTIK